VLLFSSSPLSLDFEIAGPEGAKNPAGENRPPPDSDPLNDGQVFEEISLGCQYYFQLGHLFMETSVRHVTRRFEWHHLKIVISLLLLEIGSRHARCNGNLRAV